MRSDRCICAWGLEARAPFADRDFVEFYMGLNSEVSSPEGYCEKYLLRHAFDGSFLIPDEILWRRKEAFSDGVSSKEKSWYQIIQEKYKSEEEFYKKIFCDEYGEDNLNVIPYKWMPKWCDATDPSARTLDIYLKE